MKGKKEKKENPKIAGEQAPTGSDRDFLVVDDDPGSRQIIADYLRSFGYTRIHEARSGTEALKVLREKNIGFVISDWEMPEPNGLDLLKALKSDDRYRDVPFVMVTSPISQEKYKVEDAAAAQVDGYIVKPFRSQVLREKIEHALSAQSFNEKKGVLVVDDDPDARATVVEYLKHLGFSPIFEAKDGDEGFASLQINFARIALVVSDWDMPRLAGIELLKRVRADKELGQVPFIIVTSQTSMERLKLKQAIEADVDNYLLKPFRIHEIRQKVDQMLEKAKVVHAIQSDLKRGDSYLASGRWQDALVAFHKILKLDPGCTDAYLGLAAAQRHLAPEKAIPMATQHIRKAMAINPRCVRAHIDLASIFESAMSLEKAIGCLRDALKYLPFSEDVHFHLGRLLLRRGNRAEGIRELKKALELCPGHRPAQELLAGHEGDEEAQG